MKKIKLIHLGIGNVGKTLLKQIINQQEKLKKDLGVNLHYCALFNSKGGVFDRDGLSEDQLIHFPGNCNFIATNAVEKIPFPFILIDTTASDETFPLLLKALKREGYVVMSNKKPLSGLQTDFDTLHQFGKNRFFYETTVGAALPVISVLKNLLETGDEVIEIKGCFSGTLGFLFSQLEKGIAFSRAVVLAKEKGYTEPDPRDDLSGLDVARKALILARIIGQRLELTDIKLESLYSSRMDKLTIEEFLKSVSQLDSLYKDKFQKAKKQGKALRYVASVTSKSCQVGIEAVSKESDLGSLKGPDNLIVFKTKRYFTNPLVVKGPGAGAEVTASGVFGDILSIIHVNKMI